MKQQQQQTLTPKQISEYEEMNQEFIEEGTPIRWNLPLKKPNPPTPEMVERAQFVDKTYHWKNARIRSGD